MRSLTFAMPPAGVGATTIAERLNRYPDVQAIAVYDLMLDEIADEFFMSPALLRQFKNKPTSALNLFHAGPDTRERLWTGRIDPYCERPASFYIEHYRGPLLDSPTRVSRMLGKVQGDPEHLVFFDLCDSGPDKVAFQNYATSTGRVFVLVDLTRGQSPSLMHQGAHHIENVEGNPSAAVEAFRKLMDDPPIT